MQNKCKLLYNCNLLLFRIQFCSIINCVTFDLYRVLFIISKVGLVIFISVIDVTPDVTPGYVAMGQKDKNYYECYFLFLIHHRAIFILFLKLIHVAKCYLEFDKRREKFHNALHLDVYFIFFIFYFYFFSLFLVKITFEAFAISTCYITLNNSFPLGILFHTKIYPIY